MNFTYQICQNYLAVTYRLLDFGNGLRSFVVVKIQTISFVFNIHGPTRRSRNLL